MVSVVNDSCIKCKSCVEVCPVSAFREGDSQLVVDPDTCIDCGVCISECRRKPSATMPTLTRNGLRSMPKKLLNGRKHNLPSLKKAPLCRGAFFVAGLTDIDANLTLADYTDSRYEQ